MGSKLYRYLSLVGAKLVGRRHPRDVDLPGVKELKNAFVSKSDSAITARPDFDKISEELKAVSDSFNFADSDDQDDYLNSASGIYGTSDALWFSKQSPITWDGTASSIACSQYTTGTVTILTASTSVVGVGTEWLQNAWYGCFIEFDGDGVYYKITSVNSDTSLTLSEPLPAGINHSGVSYSIYRTHQPDHADYKLNLQPFTSGMIYSCPTITMPVNANKICGPFYASVVETSSDNVWVNVQDDDLEADGNGVLNGVNENIATDGTNWIAFTGALDGDSYTMAKSSDPTDDWESVTPPSNFTPYGSITCYGSRFYIAGLSTDGGNLAAYAYTDNLGSTWHIVKHDADTTIASSVGVLPSGRVVLVAGTSGPSFKFAYYTDDPLAATPTWTDCAFSGSPSGRRGENIYYLNGTLVIPCSNFLGGYLYSTDGATFSEGSLGGLDSEYPRKCSYSTSGEFYVFIDGAGAGAKVSELGGTASGLELPSGSSHGIVWAGDKFFVACGGGALAKPKIWSTSDFIDFDEVHEGALVGTYFWSIAYSQVSGEAVCIELEESLHANAGIRFAVSNQFESTTEWRAAVFEPLSDTIRSLSHSVLDGYVVLFGTREFQSTNNKWEYHPRRIRWSTPLTYNDFDSIGSGTADLDGSGALLDSRAVNGRIVTFESSAIGAVSPRGYSSDPWEYDRIKNDVRAISNPVVVDDVCYFINDSGLLQATNGISVDSPPFPFDLTEYDDFNSDIPVWLTYSPELESLAVYNPASTDRHVYLIEPATGVVSRLEIAQVDDADPKSFVCVENSSDRRAMVSFNPSTNDTSILAVAELSTGEAITGKDEWTATAADDTYHNVDVQTGQVFIVQEGDKTGLKHLIVNTYTDGTSESTNPILVVQCKSLEDEEWHDNGDGNGVITVTDSGCTGSGTAWSNLVANSGAVAVTLPCLATQARVYVNSVLQAEGTDYTITGTKQITFSAPTSHEVYVYWENEPQVVADAGDMIQTTEGWHRITSITGAAQLQLDHYMSSGETDATATHHHGTPFPVGEGQIKIGISKLVEGVKLRFLIFHREDGDATVTKITGVSVGHIPAGRKVVEV